MRRAKSDYSIQTVVNALRALEAFEGQHDVGVSELSRKLGLHKNNVFRVLATLEECAYIEQTTENERYRLGPRCQFLGRLFRETRGGIGSVAPPFVAEIAERLGESAHVAVCERGVVRHLYGREGSARVRTGLRVGEEAPVHCTALGKVLLSCAPRYVIEEFDQEHREADLKRHTDATIVDRGKFIDHLRGVAARGWALDLREWDPEIACAAVPVFDGDDLLIGALSVSGPAFRLDHSALEGRIVPVLQEVAQRLSRALGATD